MAQHQSSASLEAELKNADPSLLANYEALIALETEAAALKSTLQAPATAPPATDQEEQDNRSIYVGNVDYAASPEELQKHFASCGTMNRVTLMCDKHTGHPKGYAYIEFKDALSVSNALTLNESLFRGRNIAITAKRTNIPGLKRGRGRGGRGRGRGFAPRGRGGYRGRGGW